MCCKCLISTSINTCTKGHGGRYFEDIDRYSVFENNIGSNTLKGFGVAKVLERLLPFKEKIKGISITNVRFERLPLVIDEHYSHIDFIKLKDCVFPESFQHPKMIVEYSEGASPIPQPNSLEGHLLSHIDELLEQLEKLSTNENIKTNAPNIKDIQLPYKVFRNGERFVTLEKNNDQPEVIVLFYEHIKSLSFSWKWTDKQTNSFMTTIYLYGFYHPFYLYPLKRLLEYKILHQQYCYSN